MLIVLTVDTLVMRHDIDLTIIRSITHKYAFGLEQQINTKSFLMLNHPVSKSIIRKVHIDNHLALICPLIKVETLADSVYLQFH